MKFVNEKNTVAKSIGKKCNPNQQFGISKEFPDYFKTTNTLIADRGYEYKYDNHKSNKFEYFSQKHFMTL